MITEANLQELLTFRSEQPMLSLYLNTDPSLGNADAYRLELRSMLKQVRFTGRRASHRELFCAGIRLERPFSGRVFLCAAGLLSGLLIGHPGD